MGFLSRIKKAVRSDASSGASGETWKDSSIPSEQWKVAEKELELLRQGKPPRVYEVAASALRSIPGQDPLTLLEAGCGCGYYSEVIPMLTGDRFVYTGGDYSDAMLAFARMKYPKISFLKLDLRNMDLPDHAYDIVLSGAVIKHIAEWQQAVKEIARVSKRYLVLHRTTVTSDVTSRKEQMSYGVPVYFQQFNRTELFDILKQCGFKLLFEEGVYPNQNGPALEMTYLLERSM